MRENAELGMYVRSYEPASFLDHVYLRRTQRECKPNETIIEQHTKMFESRISAGATENYQGGKNLMHKQLRAPTIRKDMLKTASSDTVNWQTRKWSNCTKFPCLDDHQFKQEELESVGELSEVCSQIVLKCVYLARIGRLDTLWSVNKLARSVTKWTQACDRRLARLISHSSHEKFPTVLSCGKHGTALQTGFVSRLRLCW